MGYDVELAGMLTNTMNLKMKLVEKPFAELLPALAKGDIDVIMSGMTITAERNLKEIKDRETQFYIFHNLESIPLD